MKSEFSGPKDHRAIVSMVPPWEYFQTSQKLSKKQKEERRIYPLLYEFKYTRIYDRICKKKTTKSQAIHQFRRKILHETITN